MQSREKVLVELFDADGCIYNEDYHTVMTYVILQFGRTISEFKKNPDPQAFQAAVTEFSQKLASLVRYRQGHELNLGLLGSYEMNKNALLRAHGIDSRTGVEEKFASILNQHINDLYELGPAGEELLGLIIYLTNQSLFAEITQRVTNENYSQLLIGSSSSRQSDLADALNAAGNSTGTFQRDLKQMAIKLTQQLEQQGSPVKCILDTYRVVEHVAHLQKTDSPLHLFDETKFTVLYPWLHRVSATFKENDITVSVWDDRDDIRQALFTLFSDNKDLIPRQLLLELWPYPTNIEVTRDKKLSECILFRKDAVHVIPGCGLRDENIADNMLRIGHMCGHKLKAFDEGIDVARSASFNMQQFKQEMAQPFTPSQPSTITSVLNSAVNFFSCKARAAKVPRPAEKTLGLGV